MIKWIGIAITALGMIVGAVFFLEDRYENESDAAIVKVEVEEMKSVDAEQIETLKSMQRTQEASERSRDLMALESYQNQKFLLQEKLKEDPDNSLLKDKIERLTDLIEKLETKLYQ
jgi:hypothetical protein